MCITYIILLLWLYLIILLHKRLYNHNNNKNINKTKLKQTEQKSFVFLHTFDDLIDRYHLFGFVFVIFPPTAKLMRSMFRLFPFITHSPLKQTDTNKLRFTHMNIPLCILIIFTWSLNHLSKDTENSLPFRFHHFEIPPPTCSEAIEPKVSYTQNNHGHFEVFDSIISANISTPN